MRHDGRHHWCSGFSLVELLVVIGLVALIVALILPALRVAREASRTTQCLSNLRQVGFALQTYAQSNGGVIVPGGYWGNRDGYPLPGGASWVGILVYGRYVQADAGRDGGIRQSASDWFVHPPDYMQSTIFHCPEGRTPGATSMWPPPSSPSDPAGALVVTRMDETTSQVSVTSYAINCTPLSPFGRQPFRMLPEWYPNGREDNRLMRVNQLRGASRIVMVYDGLWYLEMFDPRYVNARHTGRKVTNLLMADGHAGSQPTASLVTRQNTFVARDDVRWQID